MIGQGVVLVGEQVPVGVEGHADVRVPEAALTEQRITPGVDEDCRARETPTNSGSFQVFSSTSDESPEMKDKEGETLQSHRQCLLYL